MLAGVPNVELMTLVVALAGCTLGIWPGAACGAAAALIYSVGSPLGLPVPLLLAGQLVGLALAGILGGIMGRAILGFSGKPTAWRKMISAGGLGLLATLGYDVLTNLAIIGAFDMEPRVVLVGAIPFALWHMGANALIFVLLFPLLAHRLRGLARSSLRGQGQVLGILVLFGFSIFIPSGVQAEDAPAARADSLQIPIRPVRLNEAVTDSIQGPAIVESAPPVLTGPEAAFGWRRPLWELYSPTLVQELQWQTPWLTVQDGGLGAPVVILGEAGQGPTPQMERDGVPLGTGHSLLDDPWLVPTQGMLLGHQSMGPDLRTGTDGLLALETDDRSPESALSLYRGVKGPHETYHRGFSLLTPRAAWRLAFEFDESLDQEGYNFTSDPDFVFNSEETFRGHAKVRSSRARLIRQVDPETSLALEYSMGRKTKDELPSWGAEHQETWSTGTAATMKSRAGPWLWRSVVFQENRDSRWGDRPDGGGFADESRLLESTRQGIHLDLIAAGAPVDSSGAILQRESFGWARSDMAARQGLGVRFTQWTVADSGAVWLPENHGGGSGKGQSALVYLGADQDAGSMVATGALNYSLASHGGAALGGALGLTNDRVDPAWKLEISHSSRLPRSDELLTASRRHVSSRELFVLPNADLGREKTWRIQALGHLRLFGFDLAMDGSLRRMKNGVTWIPESSGALSGRWENGLELNSSRMTGSLARQGRFLGWGRAKLEGTWQNFDEVQGTATLLAPQQYLRLELMWEHHLFREDGILQLALMSTRRGQMTDPWDLTRATTLPEATWHDLILGFRLVGANISFAFRNLTDQQVQWTAGAVSPGRELDWRIHWYFHY